MLRSPLARLRDHRWQTVGVVVVVAAALWMAAATAAAVHQFDTASQGWFQSFGPAVYLEGGAGDEEVAALADELRDWSAIREVEIEAPEVAMERLREHLGPDEVRQLGVDAGMMPTRLVVRSHRWRPGNVELTARIEALEERDAVVAVDVPSTEAVEWLDRGRWVVLGAFVAVMLAVAGAVAALAMLLRNLQHDERREHHLLEVFGASPRSLRMATTWRGLFVGALAGLVAGLGFVGWSLVLGGFVADIAGPTSMSAARSAIWAAGLFVVGLVGGTVTGWVLGRPPGAEESGGIGSLLDWQRETR